MFVIDSARTQENLDPSLLQLQITNMLINIIPLFLVFNLTSQK